MQKATCCSCAGISSIADSYKRTPVIFIGTLIEKHRIDTAAFYADMSCTFKVIKAYKGVTDSEVTLFTASQEASCGLPFDSLKTYLIYASVGYGKLLTRLCTRTADITNRATDIQFLERIITSSFKTYFLGHVTISNGDHNFLPVTQKKIHLYNLLSNYETMTDNSGYFEFANIPANSYRVDIEIPATHTIINSDYSILNFNPLEIDLTKDSIQAGDYGAIPDGEISGIVTDKFGKPVNGVPVGILQMDTLSQKVKRDFYIETFTSDSGKYKMTRRFPGSYFVGINLEKGPTSSYPYPLMYYSSTQTMSQAKFINMGVGEKVRGIDFRIDSILPTSKIFGYVKYSNGKCMQKGEVCVYSEKEAWNGKLRESVSVDSTGHFELSVIKNSKGWINVYTWGDNNSKSHSIGPQVPIYMYFAHDIDSVNLVVKLDP